VSVEIDCKIARAATPQGVARARGGRLRGESVALIRAFCGLDGPVGAAAEASGAK
jgi:hypothetical protein